MVQELCDQALWLDHGELVMSGRTRDVIEAYGRASDYRHGVTAAGPCSHAQVPTLAGMTTRSDFQSLRLEVQCSKARAQHDSGGTPSGEADGPLESGRRQVRIMSETVYDSAFFQQHITGSLTSARTVLPVLFGTASLRALWMWGAGWGRG